MSDPYNSLDRTARWVQQHSQQQRSLHGAQHYSRLKRQDGQSSQQSSRTDLGAPEHAAGSNGRASRPRPTASVLAVAGSTQESHIQRIIDDSPLSSSTYGHRRARSQSNSLPQERHQRPPLKLPDKFYEKAPAFVQGPPGSGYPMIMSTADAPTTRSGRAVPRGPPSPPLQVPSALNPKKSRPTVQRRRPSLSGATFEEPNRSQTSSQLRMHDNGEPRVQGQEGVRRVRARAASESRRR